MPIRGCCGIYAQATTAGDRRAAELLGNRFHAAVEKR
jgi:hypothetical protein